MHANAAQDTLKHIHDSFKAAFDALPAYRHMLPFFESLFTLQEAAVGVTSPVPAEITPELQTLGRKGQLPLVDRSRMTYDKSAALNLLQAICRQAASDAATPQLTAGAEKLITALEKEGPLIESGLDLLMHDDRQAIQVLSDRLSMDEAILGFYLYHAIWPAIARQTRMSPDADQSAENWDQGYCPVCGSAPALAILADNGTRILVCEFCRCQWPFKRIQCPSCGNTDTKTLLYFFSDEEPAYRVSTCDACKKYLKTIDTRRLTRPFYPPLESIVTTHLDLQARQMGYTSTASESF